MSFRTYYNVFNPKVSQFLSGDLTKNSVESKSNDKLHKLDINDPFYQIKFNALNHERLAGLEAAKNFDEKKKKQKRRLRFVDYSEKINDANKNTSVKSLIDFDNEYSPSIKAVAIKQNTNIKVSTRFLSGKMLMLTKVSIKSFVYDLVDVFMFPNQVTKDIYAKYKIQKCYVYQNLTDTDSTSIFSIFMLELGSTIDENESRKIIFEVMKNSKIIDRLDLSDDFYEQFNIQNKKLKKQVGLFEVENINRKTF